MKQTLCFSQFLLHLSRIFPVYSYLIKVLARAVKSVFVLCLCALEFVHHVTLEEEKPLEVSSAGYRVCLIRLVQRGISEVSQGQLAGQQLDGYF